MTAEIISGKELAAEIKQDLAKEIEKLKVKNLTPKLVVVLVGDNPASLSYVKGKEKAAAEIGMDSELITLPIETTEADLLALLDDLNDNDAVHGILVQLPLPEQIDEQKVIDRIDPLKDVDGFHPINIGKMMAGEDSFLPCTPYGIITMIKSKGIKIEGKHAVIIGRSNIVGKPVGQLLLNENATVTYCHSRTENMQQYTQAADILIVAIGKENFIKQEDVKEGAVIIDVGINRTQAGKLTGDVDFAGVVEKAGYITPVPGGVGPMTITMLLSNTIKAAKGLTGIEG
ncbi:bifunctional methylenetetrahydrofolate dehydrogenase/methenyltetrahydrofolate cyclohydrolase FolD [Oceanobacillus alkalisoli]|uniref:bifunctional methylenetetrahydrofolate dehydrogenase/methenyltetrahydrofolate cyclohydrolase FolD n=1 Tax=Oceanobacillus alkalisoli TaxID=2925113 RepID=UPI001F121B14|nr:bifunctional methylenetetrahydrofolate dehydrogenase/methenyltetrahydrofolate cyclohydrolase FolD [Oceanobacillus alkalisoli]MCF3941729.1 bifunctional methylenetetrahydrofolate dehydrogenase/methenyltetrahydrofolate cyclohydrolase FolD [Oceanobacillus alkalisoli]